jgi:hypothetical protein
MTSLEGVWHTEVFTNRWAKSCRAKAYEFLLKTQI